MGRSLNRSTRVVRWQPVRLPRFRRSLRLPDRRQSNRDVCAVHTQADNTINFYNPYKTATFFQKNPVLKSTLQVNNDGTLLRVQVNKGTGFDASISYNEAQYGSFFNIVDGTFPSGPPERPTAHGTQVERHGLVAVRDKMDFGSRRDI